jgi:hypothetical protein
MSKDPTRRFQTPAEVMQALARWVATPIAPPGERELPALSPAVAGGQGGNRSGSGLPSAAGPVTLAGAQTVRLSPAPATFAGVPTAVATSVTPMPAAPVAPLPTHPGSGPAVWETLGSETQTSARGDTDRPGAIEPLSIDDEEERPARPGRRPVAGRGTGKGFLFVVFGALLLVGAVVGAYFAFFAKKESDPGSAQVSNTRKITVSKAGGEHTVPTLREALDRAGSGDTIVIAEPRLTEFPLKLNSKIKDLTIESATPDGKPAVIEYAPGAKAGGVMFDAPSSAGLKVRNVEFDGKGQAERGVQLSGFAPGATFEGVTVRGVRTTGFYLLNVAGSADRPVVLDHVRAVLAPSTEGGIVSHAYGEVTNKFVTIRNSRFEGPGKSGIRFDGPALDVLATNNRFFNLTSAVSFARPSGRVQFTNNTVYQAATGLLFEVPPPPQPPPPPAPTPPVNPVGYDLKVTNNYFAQTPALLGCPVPISGLSASENLHDGAANLGNLPAAGAAKLDAPALPTPNADDDATFLRFPGTNFPTAGPNKARVGAQ